MGLFLPEVQDAVPALVELHELSAHPCLTQQPVNLPPVTASGVADHTHPALYQGSSAHILLLKILLINLPGFLQPVLK